MKTLKIVLRGILIFMAIGIFTLTINFAFKPLNEKIGEECFTIDQTALYSSYTGGKYPTWHVMARLYNSEKELWREVTQEDIIKSKVCNDVYTERSVSWVFRWMVAKLITYLIILGGLLSLGALLIEFIKWVFK